METIHLVEGPVGAGKSTLAQQLMFEHHAPHLDLDEWMVNLFAEDRPETDFMQWYSRCKDRCLVQIANVADSILTSGSDVVLELGLVRALDRKVMYEKLELFERHIRVYLVDAPEEVRRQRVLARNAQQGHTFKMEVPDSIFDIANRSWEAPDDEEMLARNIVVL